ncbi:hypothetical protein V1511DRAFT_493167 [Dipodascopsis uninucleata]
MSELILEVDNVLNHSFTNLDDVGGRVIFRTDNEESISHITVKLEGCSVVNIASADMPGIQTVGSSGRKVIERHKFLYISKTLFPPENIQKNVSSSSSFKGYTINPGEYVYPFSFKMPLNSKCEDPSSLISKLVSAKNLQNMSPGRVHIIDTLPPSVSHPNVSIRYYIKATVARTSKLKLSFRKYCPFVFLPIEPPRRPGGNQYSFIRREHQMSYIPANKETLEIEASRKKHIFSLSKVSNGIIKRPSEPFFIEARLPYPAIVVPTQNIPIRLNISSDQALCAPVYLRELKINLIESTIVSAGLMSTNLIYKSRILDFDNLMIEAVGVSNNAEGYEYRLDTSSLGVISISDTVPPSFKTCNILRTYMIEYIMGLTYGQNSPIEKIQLLCKIEVYSGIVPPPAFINASLGSASSNQFPKKNAQLNFNKDDALPTYDESLSAHAPPIEGPRPYISLPPAYYSNVEQFDNDEKGR